MSLAENLLLAAALAADAFAVAIVRGMTGQGRNGDRLATAFCFAAAQTAMPALGYLLGTGVAGPLVHRGGDLLAGSILFLLGGKMLLDGMFEEEVAVFPARNAFYFRLLGAQAAATAIDAMPVGISLCVADTPLWPAAGIIGLVTGLLCFFGYGLGRNFFDGRLGGHAQGLGGAVLIGIALKTLF